MHLPSLFSTGFSLLGEKEFLRRVNEGKKPLDVNLGAMDDRDKQIEELIPLVKEVLEDKHAQCEHLLDRFVIRTKNQKKRTLAKLNRLVDEYCPLFKAGNMKFVKNSDDEHYSTFILELSYKD